MNRTVIRLWRKGLNLAQIASQLNLAHRVVAKTINQLRGNHTLAHFISTPDPPPDPPSDEITIMELTSHHCKAVVGRSKHRDLPLYCGRPRITSSPYCMKHAREYVGRRTQT